MENNKIGLSLIIPIFNEKDNVKFLFDELKKLFNKVDFPMEVILVDGDSSDGTAEGIKKHLELNNNLHIRSIFNVPGKGYGGDIVSGLLQAKYEILSWTHADLQTDLNDVLKGYRILLKNINNKVIVKGKRKNRNIIDKTFSFGMQLVASLKLGFILDEINAQPKVFTRKFFKSISSKQFPNDFSLDLFLLLMAKRNGYSIKQFDVFFKTRLYGEPKGGGSFAGKINLIKRTLKYIFKTK